jgi:hypothetical protein
MAAGDYNVGGANVLLYETWGGTSWSIVPSPAIPKGVLGAAIDAVSCTSATFCMAIGGSTVPYANPSCGGLFCPKYAQSTFAEEWNGSSWSVVPIPAPAQVDAGTGGISLDAVSCVTASRCVAVGSYRTDGTAPLQS